MSDIKLFPCSKSDVVCIVAELSQQDIACNNMLHASYPIALASVGVSTFGTKTQLYILESGDSQNTKEITVIESAYFRVFLVERQRDRETGKHFYLWLLN